MKLKEIFKFSIFIIAISCNIKKEEKKITEPKIEIKPTIVTSFINEKNWDSTIYYKNMLFSSNIGIDKLDKNKLTYPYAAISFKKDSIRVYAVFDKKKSAYYYLIKQYNLWRTIVDSSYNPESKSLHYFIRYYKKDSSRITIGYKMLPDRQITSVSKIKSIGPDTLCSNGYSFWGSNISIRDLLQFNEIEFKKNYKDRGLDTTLIENKVEYSIYSYFSHNYNTVKTRIRPRRYNSYFYSYMLEEINKK